MITEDSRYSGMSDGEWHRMWIRGSCEWFRYSLFEASKTERPWLEAVPHHKVHYIQTAINQVIVFQT